MMSNNFNNLDIPYYQNDKWVNMLKRKIKNLKENIEKEEEINKRLTIKNEFKNDLFANIDNHHQTQTSCPLLKPYTTQSSFHSESVYGKTTEDFRRKAFSTETKYFKSSNLNSKGKWYIPVASIINLISFGLILEILEIRKLIPSSV